MPETLLSLMEVRVEPSKKSILIVEDAIDLQMLLARFLRRKGYHVDCARNGKDALDILSSSASLPGVILLDLMMPDMDGYEFRKAQEGDERIANIPVVVMTAAGDAQVQGISMGAKGYLKKPFSNLDLIVETIVPFFK